MADPPEPESPLALAEREAKAKKAIAEADRDAAAARRAQLSALVPDLEKVKAGSLEVKGEALFGTALSRRALARAASTIAERCAETLGGKDWRLLVTGDAELATSDALHSDVTAAIQQLEIASSQLLEERRAIVELMPSPVDAVAAIAGAVPAVLSLLSAKRTVNSAAVTTSNLAAAAAVAGSLRRHAPEAAAIVHDTVRLLPIGRIHHDLVSLAERRQQLVGRKIAWEEEKSEASEAVTGLKSRVEALTEKLDDAEIPDRRQALRAELDKREDELAQARRRLAGTTARLGILDGLLTAMDGFMKELRTVPAGAARSPLASAILREQLHPDPSATADPTAAPSFTHLLLVQAESGATHEAVEDRPFWSKDKFSVVAMANATYMLLSLPDSEIVAAGSSTGAASITGSIGADFSVTGMS